MKQLPNLLKQESSSAATLVHVLVRMHSDERSTHKTMRSAVRGTLVPLGQDVINGYLPLDADTQARNIAAWTPVVAEVVTGLCTFEDDEAGEGRIFTEFTGPFYPLAVDLLGKDPLAPEICEALRAYFYKVGITQRLIDPAQDEERKRVLEAGKQNERDQRDSRVRESASIPEIQLSRPGAAPAPTSSAQEGQRRVMIEDPIPNAPTPPKSSTELPAAPEQVVDAQDSDPVADTETTRDAPQPDEEKQPAVEGEAAS